jgi:hypothetical protein
MKKTITTGTAKYVRKNISASGGPPSSLPVIVLFQGIRVRG